MDTEDVVFPCKKCGKTIRRSESKLGTLVACARCHKVNRTPGIATQPQATERQLALISRCWEKFTLWFCIFAPLTLLALLLRLLVLAGNYWGVAALILEVSTYRVAALALGLSALGSGLGLVWHMAQARRYLGGSRGFAFALFLFLFPVWVILTIITYFRLRRRVRALKEAGPRVVAPG